MLRFVSSRLVRTALTIFIVMSFAFVLARLTGDPVRLMLPNDATPQDVAVMRSSLGLNQPLALQYGRFLLDAVHGDLGNSMDEERRP